MEQSFNKDEHSSTLSSVTFLIGDSARLSKAADVPVLRPFDERILEFMNILSGKLLRSNAAKSFSDVITFGFWLRKASMTRLAERFRIDDRNLRLGRGVAFHIAPSNVPVNYAYSLAAGLLTGNINIVRTPSKTYEQVDIINGAISEALTEYDFMRDYIYLVRYERNREINDLFSQMADVRVVWGGDSTIAEIRNSKLKPRATEITFADRYSIAIIDSERYLETEDKERFAENFYNDTYLNDQNACTSPRLVVWMGKRIEEAKNTFWTKLHDIVAERYNFQPIMGINKLTSSYLMAITGRNAKVLKSADNLISRVALDSVDAQIMDIKDNAGYFFEYDCDDIMNLHDVCNDTRCQTIAFCGDKEAITPLLQSGIRGVDRIVSIGNTMDFDLIWDGYNLYERFTRIIYLGFR